MANTNSNKILVVIVAILAVFQVSCAITARHHHGDDAIIASEGGTPAVMTLTEFGRGEGGGGPAACDGQYHGDDEMIAAVSTLWYGQGQRCGKTILIFKTDLTHPVEVKVVDECDSGSGCKDNMIATSKAVWDALGFDTNAGEVSIVWTDQRDIIDKRRE